MEFELRKAIMVVYYKIYVGPCAYLGVLSVQFPQWIRFCYHWRRLVKNITGETKILGSKNLKIC